MTGPDVRPDAWSYSTERVAPQRTWVRRRAVWIAAAVVVVAALVVGVLLWSARPDVPKQAQTDVSFADKPPLNDKPPTLIKSAIQPRSLYPPGYVDFDESKADPNRGQTDRDVKVEKTSTTPGCDENPLFEAEFNLKGTDQNRYRDYPVILIIDPVDDPGGLGEDRGFTVSVFPAKNPTSLDDFRQWFSRCKGAQITYTSTKFGQVVDRSTTTMDEFLTDAPSSVASDSFARQFPDREICDYYGLVRGMIVNVTCPPNQKDEGAQLFRTVVLRIWNA